MRAGKRLRPMWYPQAKEGLSMLKIAGLTLLECAAAFAQGTTATISGNVPDASGSAIAGASVTATNVDTNVTRKQATQADGAYSVLFLPIGTYRVEITATGFKKFEQTGIVLEVNRNAKVDAALQVGALTETIEISADALLVETTNPALGQVVNNKDIDNMPLVN